MPNWCSNSIKISGPYDKLKKIKEDSSKFEADEGLVAPGLLEALVPIGDWSYVTASEAWGTKWDVSAEDLELTDNGDGTGIIEGHFNSAWGPPTEAFETYCNDNDDVDIECYYFEPGMCFVGCWNEGDDDYHVYEDATSETVREMIPEYLVDYFDLEEELAQWEEQED